MSEVKHAYRIMVIDIDKDEVVLDEFCDSIVAGIGRQMHENTKAEAKEFVASKSTVVAQIFSIKAAEKAAFEAKKEVVHVFRRNAPEEVLKRIFEDVDEEDIEDAEA